jgi:hypothetical protein
LSIECKIITLELNRYAVESSIHIMFQVLSQPSPPSILIRTPLEQLTPAV